MIFDGILYDGNDNFNRIYVGNTLYGYNTLHFIAVEDDCAVAITHYNGNVPDGLQYMLYKSGKLTEWTDWDGSEIELDEGNILYVKSNEFKIGNGHSQFVTVGELECCGSIASLDLNNTSDIITKNYAFDSLFLRTSIISAPELPYTTLTLRCYNAMFGDCTSLKKAPKLPATTLASECYANMFGDCISLTTAPELPATNLDGKCYMNMFVRCKSLITAPELPATTLAGGCYNSMFFDCTSLTESPILQAKHVPSGAYGSMFKYCNHLKKIITYADTIEDNSIVGWVGSVSSNGEFYNYGRYSYLINSMNGLPYGWNYVAPYAGLQFTAIEDCAIALNNYGGNSPQLKYCIVNEDDEYSEWVDWNYSEIDIEEGNTVIFKGDNASGFSKSPSKYSIFVIYGKVDAKGSINSLLYEDNLYNLTLPNEHCFYGCFVQTDIVDAKDLRLPANILKNYCYSNMFRWCKYLISAPALPATNLAYGCYANMFSLCGMLSTAPALPATTLASQCYASMFSSCTSLTTAPELPATTLVTACYGSMFNSCSKLNYIKAMFTTQPSGSYTLNWVYSVSPTGTFVKNKDAAWSSTGNNSVPEGWTIITE